MNEDDMDDNDHSSCSSSTSSTSSPVNSQDHKSLSHSQNLISKEEAAVVDNKQQLQRRTVVGTKLSSNMNHSERVSGFAAEGFEEYLRKIRSLKQFLSLVVMMNVCERNLIPSADPFV
jgi:hypothetical protein